MLHTYVHIYLSFYIVVFLLYKMLKKKLTVKLQGREVRILHVIDSIYLKREHRILWEQLN